MEVKINERTMYQCPVCGRWSYTKDGAKRCCPKRVCEDCGKELDKEWHYTVCSDCKEKRRIKREQDTLNKAKKYTIADCPSESKEMMYSELYGYNEGYFSELEEFIDYCIDEGIEIPKYVWGTHSYQISFDAESMIESECDELHEGAYDWIDSENIKELQDFLDAWCLKQTGTRTYVPDWKIAISTDLS